MKTIKLPIEYLNMEDMEILQEYTRLQNNVIRIAYNRFRERNQIISKDNEFTFGIDHDRFMVHSIWHL